MANPAPLPSSKRGKSIAADNLPRNEFEVGTEKFRLFLFAKRLGKPV
jgi:hypothetical protein